MTFFGPGDDLDRLRIPSITVGNLIDPAVEAQLNERQQEMVAMLVNGEVLTSSVCQEKFGVVKDTVNRDFQLLVKLKVAVKEGGGRSTHYRLKS